MTEREVKVPNPNPDWQDRDIRLRPLVVALAVMAGLTAFAILAMWLLISHYKRQAADRADLVSPLATARELPPAPRLQVVPLDELAAHRAVEDRFLTQYQLMDEAAGTARIPVERAMAILADGGLPARQGAPSP